MTRQTSIEAYNTIRENGSLSSMRFSVYELLYKEGPLTASQVHTYMCKGNVTNGGSYTGRLSELRRLGVVMEIGLCKCPYSGRNVILWDVTKNLPVKPKLKECIDIDCPHCKGTGKIKQETLFEKRTKN